MKHSDRTFQWAYTNPSLIFPIDYSSKEYQREFGQDSRNFRKYVLSSYLFEGVLRGLTFISNEKDMPLIPLEAVPFLDCFYKVAQKSEYRSLVFDSEPQLSSIMEHFWDELCAKLYEETAPPQDSEKTDSNAFCRHTLFQNKQFVSALLAPYGKRKFRNALMK